MARRDRDSDSRVGLPPDERPATLSLTATAFAAIATLLSLILTASGGAPYLSWSDLNGWLAIFAATLLVLLCLLPFALNAAITTYRPERAESWDASLMLWGALGAAGTVAGFLLASAGGWATGSSLSAAAGLILLIETAPIALGVLFWMLAD